MKNKDGVGLAGRFTLIARHSDDEVFAVRDIMNTITNSGMEEVASLICGVTSTEFTYIGLGTDTENAAAATDTQLYDEIDYTSVTPATRGIDAAPTSPAKVAIIVDTFAFGEGGEDALTEVGLFNDTTAGIMLARQTFAVINVAEGDSLTATWNITVGV